MRAEVLTMLNSSDLIAVAAVSLLASLLGSYIRRKGENLATKEDIAEITRKQEKVRDEFQNFREQSTQRHQLRLAALDRRLEKHQEAYTLWWELVRHANKKNESGNIAMECQTWWVNNCLYLDSQAREHFRLAYNAAFIRPTFWEVEPPHRDPTGMEENWNIIMKAGEAIETGVELPSIRISEEELNRFGKPAPR